MDSTTYTRGSVKSATALQQPPMKNGKFRVVLLAGGPADLAREIRDKLMKSRGILIKYHLEYDKKSQWEKPIPRDVDFVIVLKDMMSHQQYYKVKEACKLTNTYWVVTQRKLSAMLSALQKVA